MLVFFGRAFFLERYVKFYTWYSTTGGVGGRSESHIGVQGACCSDPPREDYQNATRSHEIAT